MSATVKEKATVYNLPEGRLINHALFERDAFAPEKGASGKAKYKVELRFDPAQLEEIEQAMADVMEKTFGKKVADDWFDRKPYTINPMLDGNTLAANREAKGKEGTAYKGGLVIRADTTFNKDGVEGPGGLNVYGPDCAPILATEQGSVYPGCYGIAAVTFSTYKDYPRTGDRGIKCYLVAFQKTRDGDKLSSSGDKSSLFKPVGGAPAAGEVRRRRAG